MTITPGYELATDPFFRELSNFITPPRAGKVTAIEGSGQVRVDTDDPDGGDVLAWPLNDFTYSVDDVVYVQFGVNNPDSAIVLGSKGAVPTLASYIRRNGADTLTADWDFGSARTISGGNINLSGNFAVRVVGTTRWVMQMADNLDGDGVPFMLSNSEGGAGSTNESVSMLFGLRDGTLTAETVAGRILVGKEADFTSGANRSSFMDFYTTKANSSTVKGRITADGNWGFGTTSPQGKLQAFDGTGGFLFVTKTGVVGTAITIIPNATGDVTKSCYVLGILTNSTPTFFTINHRIDNGGSQNYNDGGGNTLQLAVAANGTLTAQRTLGAATWALTMLVVWQ